MTPTALLISLHKSCLTHFLSFCCLFFFSSYPPLWQQSPLIMLPLWSIIHQENFLKWATKQPATSSIACLISSLLLPISIHHTDAQINFMYFSKLQYFLSMSPFSSQICIFSCWNVFRPRYAAPFSSWEVTQPKASLLHSYFILLLDQSSSGGSELEGQTSLHLGGENPLDPLSDLAGVMLR